MWKFLSLCMTVALFAAPVNADCDCGNSAQKFSEKGGFIDEVQKPISIADVKKLSDDAAVMVEGHIVKKLSDDEYEFSDGKHTIVVEIDDDDWNGNKVTAKDKVLIRGEVDKELSGMTIDVDHISIVK